MNSAVSFSLSSNLILVDNDREAMVEAIMAL